MKICKNCGTPSKDNWQFCAKCGQSIEVIEIDKTEDDVQEYIGNRCGRCGFDVDIDALYCERCGYPLSEDQNHTDKTPSEKSARRIKPSLSYILIGLYLVIVCQGGTALVYTIFSNEAQTLLGCIFATFFIYISYSAGIGLWNLITRQHRLIKLPRLFFCVGYTIIFLWLLDAEILFQMFGGVFGYLLGLAFQLQQPILELSYRLQHPLGPVYGVFYTYLIATWAEKQRRSFILFFILTRIFTPVLTTISLLILGKKKLQRDDNVAM